MLAVQIACIDLGPEVDFGADLNMDYSRTAELTAEMAAGTSAAAHAGNSGKYCSWLAVAEALPAVERGCWPETDQVLQ